MRRVLAISIVVVLAGAAAFLLLRRAEPGGPLTEAVEAKIRRGDFAAAREERESIRGRLDEGWNAYLDGVFLLSEGTRPAAAAEALERARKAHPREWKVVASAAAAVAGEGRFPDVRAVIDDYVAAVPDDERGLAAAAECRLDTRMGPLDAAKALELLDRVAALPKRVAPPNDATSVSDGRLHRLRAKALVVSGRFVEAMQEAREAARADPNDAEAWYLLGDAARLAKPPQAGESLQAYRRAFELAPTNRRYGEQFVMATLKFVVPGPEAASRFTDALTAVEEMRRAAPDDPALLILKARIFARSEQTLDASNEIYVELQKRPLPKELRLQVLRNRGVLLYDWGAAGRQGPYLKDAYDLLRQYLDEGGVLDDDLRDTWSKLQIYAPK